MPKQSQRIIFAGTPEFSALHLEALIESKHQLIATYTQPDRPAGRGKKLQASPVKRLAIDAGLPVYQPASLREATAQQHLASLGADIMVVVAYGLILPSAVLNAPRLGCINVHASLLPRWRGAAPIQRAIEAGDDHTGITIMQMDEGLDTGDMLACASCPIEADTTAASLQAELAQIGPTLLLEVLENVPSYQSRAQRQDDEHSTYARKITKAEAAIDWSRDAQQLDRMIRAFNPVPVCYTALGDQRVRIWAARPETSMLSGELPGTIIRTDSTGIWVACGAGCLQLQSLQLAGGKQLAAGQLLTAHKSLFAPGARFTSASTNSE